MNQDESGTEDPYAGLFRPAELEPVEAESVEAESVEAESVEAESVEVESVTPEPVAPEPAQPDTPPSITETGRVFKSLGVSGHEEALVAIPLHKASKLRTLTRDSVEQTDVLEVATPVARVERTRKTQSRPEFIGSLSAIWVYGITIGVTFVVGLGDVLLFGGEPGALSGIGLLLASIFVSFAVKPSDETNAIYAPAIAFFLMAITIGQLNASASSISTRFIEVFFILGNNWIWILGSTAFALTVVAIRRRSRR